MTNQKKQTLTRHPADLLKLNKSFKMLTMEGKRGIGLEIQIEILHQEQLMFIKGRKQGMGEDYLA